VQFGRFPISWSPRFRPRNALTWLEHGAAVLGARWLVAFAIRHRPRRRSRSRSSVSHSLPGEAPDRPAFPLDEALAQGDHGLYEKVPAWKRGEWDGSSLAERFKRWLLGRERVPIPSYTGLIEEPPSQGAAPKTGICCSGGGIRSAAFNLGALQELQNAKRLQKAKYLAAVSGGAYIAAAFSMVAKTPKADDQLNDDSDPELVTSDRPPFYHGSPEEQYLRNHSSYLAPGGIGRARFILRVALGLLLNLAFLTAGLVLLAWVLALFYRHAQKPLQEAKAEAGTTNPEWILLAVVAGTALILGLISVLLRSTADRSQRALETLTIYGLGLAALILVIAVALPELISLIRNQGVGHEPHQVSGGKAQGGVAAAAGGGFGALLVAVLLELRSKLSIEDAEKAVAWYRKLAAPLRRAVAQIIAWFVGPLLLASILAFALLAMVSAKHISPWWIGGVAIVLALYLLFSDATSWSLHPFYRRRLCTAFALKRIKGEFEGRANIGVAVEREYRKLVPLSESGVEPGPGPLKTWPTLLVCAAANVSDPAATPPGRSVTSFTFSPVAMGGPLVGGVRTAAFEDHLPPERRRDFTLAAAVAMSGAAVSPAMGKETRRSIRFLLGLANVRLGVWVPNPRRTKRWIESRIGLRTQLDRIHDVKHGRVEKYVSPLPDGASESQRDVYRKSLFVPRAGPWYLLKEMCGWNSINDPYLYVTDGGHYENLGLVELLRRGCTEIFCFDASGGKRLDALGDAIALARSELSVEIDGLDVAPLKEKDDDRLAERCCVRGRITYPTGQKGVLIFARSVVTREAPYDVQAFRIRDKAFPHHSTLDQLYTDEKFEAYRELGVQAGRAALKEAADGGRQLFGSALAPAVATTERLAAPSASRDTTAQTHREEHFSAAAVSFRARTTPSVDDGSR
jgi:hypothetical protein